MTQLPLMPPTEKEQIATLKEALKEYGKHSLYCCWVYEGGYYDKTLGCTCGLEKTDDIQR